MKLKRYNNFINESNGIYHINKLDQLNRMITSYIEWSKPSMVDFEVKIEDLKKLRSDFKLSIISVSEDSPSFSSLSQSNRDPEEDFKNIQNKLDKLGFNLEYIKKLFCKELNEIVGDFKSFITSYAAGNSLDSINGEIDIYLFLLNKKLNIDKNTEVHLGGKGWADLINDPDSSYPGEEVIVKYAYGYHQTKYGKLLLNQIKMSLEDFIEETFYQLERAIIAELCYLFKSTSFSSHWPLVNFNLGLYPESFIKDKEKQSRIAYAVNYNDVQGIIISYDRFESILDKNIISVENALVFKIESFYDDILSEYGDKFDNFDEVYDRSRQIIIDSLESWKNLTLGNKFKIEILSDIIKIS
jgi:hypothetical protein